MAVSLDEFADDVEDRVLHLRVERIVVRRHTVAGAVSLAPRLPVGTDQFDALRAGSLDASFRSKAASGDANCNSGIKANPFRSKTR